MADDWSARQYLKFEDERTRPPRDLLAQVPLAAPRRVIDLGCGPGNSTELLIERYPQAEVIGLDSSPDMLRQARERLPGCRFLEADLAHLAPAGERRSPVRQRRVSMGPRPSRGVAASARGTAARRRIGGADARQHAGAGAGAHGRGGGERARGRPLLRSAAAARDDLPTPAAYYDLLRPLCAHLDIWHTVYNHVLAGPEAIVEWFRGSGLRPFLAPLDEDMRKDFVADYRARIAQAYPVRFDGKVLLRFPRLFIVAVR